ncbi:TonB-dependent receptor [Fulvitalea axinellae]|uniref:TonB-dependent receptor n=2 Tax=Fulvitalea axinellae TaxID=1182444 RepID=A0AAU9CIJ6_9BACT|nr:TonB-dependent receptor [Fulvitalea axinellae]
MRALKQTLLLAIAFTFASGVSFAQQRTVTGHVSDKSGGDALIGVSVAKLGSPSGTITDVEGNFSLTVENTDTLEFRFVGYIPLKVTVAGNKHIQVALEQTDVSLSEVVVVGSRSADRSLSDTPVPVDVIPMAKILEQFPQPDLNSILTYIAPSFQSNRQTIADGTDHIDPASLRNLGPDQVLVLVNGKRRHNTALLNLNGTFGRGSVGTDLNTIPVSAIERIEVLRDGASAQYGSDAIAGVINIVLKQQTEGLNGQVTGGIHKEGDGELVQFTSNYGVALGESGFLNLSVDLSKRGHTNRMKEFTGKIFEDDNGNDITDEELERRGLERSDFNMRVGNSESLNAGIFLNGGYQLSEKNELYAFGGLNYRNGISTAFYRLPYQSRTDTDIYPNGFLPEIVSYIQDQSLTVGLRSELGAWDLDIYNTYGRNSFDFGVENTSNRSLGKASPTSFEAGGYAFSQNITGLGLTRKYDLLSGLNVAAGAEFRVDRYQIIAGEEASWKNYSEEGESHPGGSQGFTGFTPESETDQTRSNVAFYGDAELDITDSWLVAGAARFEEYSDFGNTVTWKLASRYKFGDFATLRGAYNTGFRAPSLHQVHFSSVSTVRIDGEFYEVGTFRNNSAAARALGIPELKEETSRNISLGLTLNPASNIQLSADVYRVDIDDRIILTGTFGSDPAINSILESVGADRAQFFTNAIDTRTQGVDLVVSSQWNVGSGILDATLSGNWNNTEVVGDVKTSELLQGKEDVYFGRRERGRIEDANPKSKYNLTLTYGLKRWSFLVRNVRFGEVKAYHSSDPDQDQGFSAKIVTDASVTYRLTEGLRLTVGANNLFDIYPDRNREDRQSSGRFIYPRSVTQFGSNGAFFFGRLSFNIKNS